MLPKGYKHSPAVCKKIAEANKIKWADKNKKAQMAKRVGDALRGRPKSKAHCRALQRAWDIGKNKGFTGRRMTEEHKQHLSAAIKGHPCYSPKQTGKTKVKHHVYLRENDPDTVMVLTCAKHHSLHKRAYDYLYARFGKQGIDEYLKWFDQHFGLDG